MLFVNQTDCEVLLPNDDHQQAACGQNLPHVHTRTWVKPRDQRSTLTILKITNHPKT